MEPQGIGRSYVCLRYAGYFRYFLDLVLYRLHGWTIATNYFPVVRLGPIARAGKNWYGTCCGSSIAV